MSLFRDLLIMKSLEDFQTIIKIISKIGETWVLERYFRPENRAKAIPIYSSKLRLYGVRLSDHLLILGNGGIKTSQKVDNSPDCYPKFRLMNEIDKVLRMSIKEKNTSISNNKLGGRLKFKTNLLWVNYLIKL